MTLYQIDIKTNWHRICKQKSHKHPRTFLGWQITGACLQRNCYDPGHHVGKAGIHLYTRIPNNVIVTQCTDLLHHFHHDSKMRPLLSETMGSTKEHSIAWKYSPRPHWQWNFLSGQPWLWPSQYQTLCLTLALTELVTFRMRLPLIPINHLVGSCPVRNCPGLLNITVFLC